MKIIDILPKERRFMLWFNVGATDPPGPITWGCVSCGKEIIAEHDCDRNELSHNNDCMLYQKPNKFKPKPGGIEERLLLEAKANRRKRGKRKRKNNA